MRSTFNVLGIVSLCGFVAACGGGSNVDEDPDPVPEAACETVDRPLPIPLEYALAGDHLDVVTPGGPLEVRIGPWGAHVQPHTGHPEGNVKSDWYGLFTPTRTSPGLVEIAYGSGDVIPGGCDPGARCGVLESELFARRPTYRFPADAVRVVRVELLEYRNADPFDGMSWEVELSLCPYGYVLGHVQSIADGLADAIVSAGGADPRVAPMVGTDYAEGLDLTVPANTPLAYPHVRSRVIDDNPAYRGGVDSVPDVPWVQIEWTALHRGLSADGVARPEYTWMAPELMASLASILETQADTDVFRYAPVPHFLWAAEHVLVATPPFLRDVQTGLTDGLGGWSQRPESGICEPAPYATPDCAETFSIFRIHTEGAHYDPSDYSTKDVRYLVHRSRAAGDESDFVAFGEVVSPSEPDPVSGTLLVRWRHAFDEELQRVGYRLDVATGRMRFRYGERVPAAKITDPSDVPAVAIPSLEDACTASTLICMTAPSYGRF